MRVNWKLVGGLGALGGGLAWWLWPRPEGEVNDSPAQDADVPSTSIDAYVPHHQRRLIPRIPHHRRHHLKRLQTEGRAVEHARRLYRDLRHHHHAPHDAVLAFQRATNRDPFSRLLIGPVPETGIYDPRTSAALTMYTEDPVPAHPSLPDLPVPTSPASIFMTPIPGNAAAAGSNLYVYLQTHGRDGTQALRDLTARFQHAVNTDPKFPGPAVANGLPMLIVDPLKVDGRPGPKTLRALGTVTPRQVRV